MSRISTAQQFSLTQEHIAKAKEKEHISSEKSSSLKELTRPSQAPAEYVIAQDMKDDVAIREGIAKNAALANHVLNATENVIAQGQDILQKLHELAISASNKTINPDVARHTLPEAQGLAENLIQAFNTKFGNRVLLAGFKGDSHAFSKEGEFLGDDNAIQIEIDRGLKMPINLSASKLVKGQGVVGGVDILAVVKGFVDGLREDDIEKIRGSLDGLAKATDQLSTGRTEIAGRQLEIQRAIETNNINGIQKKDSISQIEEADPVKVFSELARDQTVLKAAMETSRKILTETSVDTLFKT